MRNLSAEQEVRLLEQQNEALRKDILFLIRKLYGILGELAWNDLAFQSPALEIRVVKRLIGELDASPDGRKRLADFLDGHLDHVVEDLRNDLKLNDDDVLLFCYCVIGLNTACISELMGLGNGCLYTRKCRLVRKIKGLGPARSRRYLDLLP